MLKRIGLILLLIILIMAGIVFYNATNIPSKQINVKPVTDILINKDSAAVHLSDAIKMKTISHLYQYYGKGQVLKDFGTYLEKTYPLIHTQLKKVTIADYTLIFKWEGKNPSLKPIMLLGHFDVVPVDGSSEKDWAFAPFEGNISEGKILGRGTMDDKQNVIAIMEAVEHLLAQKFVPERTIYLSFGHDEEVGGQAGAVNVVKHLQEQKVELEFVLDEGGVIAQGIIPGIQKPVALVGIAEKGYMSLELTYKGEGGHSSTPPKETSIGIMSKALARLEDNPLPMSLSGATLELFNFLMPEMDFSTRLFLNNRWLFNSAVLNQLSQSSSTNATIRTTTALTMFNGGVKDNVIPIEVKAMVNFRILPGETKETVMNHVKKMINNPKIQITPTTFVSDPSVVSDVNAKSFKMLHQTIKEICPDVFVAPYLVTGGTDSRFFSPVTKNIYRFGPLRVKQDDLKKIHGTNEMITVDNMAECVRFFVQVIRNTNTL